MKKVWQKIIVSVLMLGFFLAPVGGGYKVSPSISFAQNGPFHISSTNKYIKSGDTIVVVVTALQLPEGTVTFSSNAAGGISTPVPCIVPASFSLTATKTCNVQFSPTATGTFDITATGVFGQATYTSSVQINVTADGLPPPPEPNIGAKPEGWKGYELGCSLWDGVDGLAGCIAWLTYTIWSVIAIGAELAGRFLDFFVYYATSNEAYKSGFVEEGWKVVRDVANIFFILVLLFIAIKTILGLNVSDNKKLVTNIIIIGLVINFSLFASRVVIDSSNILAKMFYNNIDSNATGKGGEVAISVGLIKSYNPQRIVSHEEYKLNQGTFIFITVLLILITIYTALIFLQVSLLFVGRVVSLWISMIFSPIAFLSHALPFKIPKFGWSDWSGDLLKNAFLAPMFVFFLYLTVLFTEFLGEIVNYPDAPSADGWQNTMHHFMKVVIPFIILYVLLRKAKELTEEYSGELGKGVKSIGTAVGGLALGAGAMSVAALGRGTAGAVAKYAQDNSARKNALTYKDTSDQWKKMKGTWRMVNPLDYMKLGGKAVLGTGKFMQAGVASGVNAIGQKTDPHTGKVTSAFQRSTDKFGDKLHATHVLDEKAKEITGNKEAVYRKLTSDEQKKVRDRIDRDVVSQELFNKNYANLKQTERASVDGYRTPGDPRGEWAAAADMSKTLAAGRGEHVHTAEDLGKNIGANTTMSEFLNAVRKGTHDIRNLPDMSAKSKGFVPKFTVGLIAGTAGLVRKGIKEEGIGIAHYGTPQGNIWKDISNTISESLKNVNVADIKITGGGGGGGGHKPSGGGGHGGGHH